LKLAAEFDILKTKLLKKKTDSTQVVL